MVKSKQGEEFVNILQSYHNIYDFKAIIHKLQESYVMCNDCGPVQDPEYHKDLINIIEGFALENDVFIYNNFKSIEDIVCRK